jgi:hypothetical protein
MKIYSYSLAIFKLHLCVHIQLDISHSLFLNPNYFDTLQFEANTHHPTAYVMLSRFKTFIQTLYAKIIEKKINICLGICIYR